MTFLTLITIKKKKNLQLPNLRWHCWESCGKVRRFITQEASKVTLRFEKTNKQIKNNNRRLPCYHIMPSGSLLSKDVFERPKSTGSGLFTNLGRDFNQFLDQIVSMIEKTFRNTNLIASRHLRREKNSLPVDVRHLTCCLARILYKETSPCNRVFGSTPQKN